MNKIIDKNIIITNNPNCDSKRKDGNKLIAVKNIPIRIINATRYFMLIF
jgi:hypothetical protein